MDFEFKERDLNTWEDYRRRVIGVKGENIDKIKKRSGFMDIVRANNTKQQATLLDACLKNRLPCTMKLGYNFEGLVKSVAEDSSQYEGEIYKSEWDKHCERAEKECENYKNKSGSKIKKAAWNNYKNFLERKKALLNDQNKDKDKSKKRKVELPENMKDIVALFSARAENDVSENTGKDISLSWESYCEKIIGINFEKLKTINNKNFIKVVKESQKKSNNKGMVMACELNRSPNTLKIGFNYEGFIKLLCLTLVQMSKKGRIEDNWDDFLNKVIKILSLYKCKSADREQNNAFKKEKKRVRRLFSEHLGAMSKAIEEINKNPLVEFDETEKPNQDTHEVPEEVENKISIESNKPSEIDEEKIHNSVLECLKYIDERKNQENEEDEDGIPVNDKIKRIKDARDYIEERLEYLRNYQTEVLAQDMRTIEDARKEYNNELNNSFKEVCLGQQGTENTCWLMSSSCMMNGFLPKKYKIKCEEDAKINFYKARAMERALTARRGEDDQDTLIHQTIGEFGNERVMCKFNALLYGVNMETTSIRRGEFKKELFSHFRTSSTPILVNLKNIHWITILGADILDNSMSIFDSLKGNLLTSSVDKFVAKDYNFMTGNKQLFYVEQENIDKSVNVDLNESTFEAQINSYFELTLALSSSASLLVQSSSSDRMYQIYKQKDEEKFNVTFMDSNMDSNDMSVDVTDMEELKFYIFHYDDTIGVMTEKGRNADKIGSVEYNDGNLNTSVYNLDREWIEDAENKNFSIYYKEGSEDDVVLAERIHGIGALREKLMDLELNNDQAIRLQIKVI